VTRRFPGPPALPAVVNLLLMRLRFPQNAFTPAEAETKHAKFCNDTYGPHLNLKRLHDHK
jgi:hypothetical protein